MSTSSLNRGVKPTQRRSLTSHSFTAPKLTDLKFTTTLSGVGSLKDPFKTSLGLSGLTYASTPISAGTGKIKTDFWFTQDGGVIVLDHIANKYDKKDASRLYISELIWQAATTYQLKPASLKAVIIKNVIEISVLEAMLDAQNDVGLSVEKPHRSLKPSHLSQEEHDAAEGDKFGAAMAATWVCVRPTVQAGSTPVIGPFERLMRSPFGKLVHNTYGTDASVKCIWFGKLMLSPMIIFDFRAPPATTTAAAAGKSVNSVYDATGKPSEVVCPRTTYPPAPAVTTPAAAATPARRVVMPADGHNPAQRHQRKKSCTESCIIA